MTRSIEHDLRAPIAAIEGYVRVILGSPDDAKTASRLEGILASCRTMEHIVENLRLSRLLAEGRLEMTEPGADLGALLERTADGLARAFEGKRARLRVLPTEIRIARGADLFERIAASLVLAALNTSSHGAEVSLGASRESASITVFLCAERVAGPGPGNCLDLVAEAARRLGGSAAFTPGRLAISIPESAVV
jgi:signal transduction histidine kinase